MRYILIALQHLFMVAFGFTGIVAVFMALVLLFGDGFSWLRLLMIPGGVVCLAVAFWINDLDI